MDTFFQICKSSNAVKDWFYVGGMTEVERSLTEWYWVESGRKINFPIKFSPGEPNSSNDNVEKCLSVAIPREEYGFNDVSCTANKFNWSFVCQSRLFNAPGI